MQTTEAGSYVTRETLLWMSSTAANSPQICVQPGGFLDIDRQNVNILVAYPILKDFTGGAYTGHQGSVNHDVSGRPKGAKRPQGVLEPHSNG
ncbi:hypothetical protein ASPCADRAFT_206316 [Aspergillus carbonarius ITEM 5010]|uniref:Uncharacterized protein n=1 Tax=Aspergillus carbonarius (strain ITEM 5010) TaxID=602072 RepID=A0A1R3RSN3_ASPC5|nr:hypothetical protein ASPCADRAFT_206316 [Aspergillus carbonarius ITEM 5010]